MEAQPEFLSQNFSELDLDSHGHSHSHSHAMVDADGESWGSLASSVKGFFGWGSKTEAKKEEKKAGKPIAAPGASKVELNAAAKKEAKIKVKATGVDPKSPEGKDAVK